MASIITCTPAGASDNCYITLAYADTYFDNTLRDTIWQAFEGDQQDRALIQATKEIEQRGGIKSDTNATRSLFPGAPSDEDQALHFPRGSDEDADGNLIIPQGVADAVCEQAFWLLQQRDNPVLLDRDGLQAAGVRNVAIDGLSETYGPRTIPRGMAPLAWPLIRPYIRRALPTVAER